MQRSTFKANGSPHMTNPGPPTRGSGFRRKHVKGFCRAMQWLQEVVLKRSDGALNETSEDLQPIWVGLMPGQDQSWEGLLKQQRSC